MDKNKKRKQAWIGDAVLALFAREWILSEPSITVANRAATFVQMTSNQFLSAIGEPTAMEAEIGQIYQKEGLHAAFELINKKFIPVFKKQQKNRLKKSGNYRNKNKA